ncbi:MAG: hypothetical protein HN350_04995 [Phycisphaerales bacterium]|jgi:flagellar basal-body rod protein FlgB|nr:hypothetical protein [Phycisphaerales bacterium]
MAGKVSIINYLEAGIKGSGMRQAAIANNIANMGTPGYRRVDVTFENRLAKAIADGKEVSLDELEQEIIRPKNTTVDANGNDVTLEMEIGAMVKNVSMQKTYLRLLARTYRKMQSAITLK